MDSIQTHIVQRSTVVFILKWFCSVTQVDIRKGKDKPLYCLLANNGFKEISFLMISNSSRAKPNKKYTNLIYHSWSSTMRTQTCNLKLEKDLKGHFTKEDPQTAKKHMKEWCILYVIRSGKCHLKQWDTPIHLLEWPQSETWTSPNAVNDTEQKELSFISDRYAKWYSKFGS